MTEQHDFILRLVGIITLGCILIFALYVDWKGRK